ncbi:hypothetical protein [Halioxenophilus aromaticivorans]|uniref:Sulphotransferase Stf0 domain-containing protein n=1 Tax=Halioxenophilus aromaticivorans TaxID=1306992 RepID=A0AAV3U099_9ALTE
MKGLEVEDFVVFAQPRTGTNALIARLNRHEKILCHYELFHPKEIYYCENKLDKAVLNNHEMRSLEFRDKNVGKFLSYLSSSKEDRLFGYKIFSHHNPSLMKERAENRLLKKIIVYRANLLDQYISTEIALSTNAYTYKEEAKDISKVAEFNYSKFLRFVAEERKILNYYVSVSVGDVFLLEYTSAVMGSLVDLFEFLGLDQKGGPTEESSSFKKQNSYKTRDKVINFDEVVESLKDSEFEWMIVD